MSSSVKKVCNRYGYGVCLETTPGIEDIEKQLTIYPKVNQQYTHVKPKPVKCFRKSEKMLYLPYSYGYKKFGAPDKEHLRKHEPLPQLEFNGQLRPYQKKVVKSAEEALSNPSKRGGILALSTRSGKCLGKGTKVMMFRSGVKNVENVRVGELLMGDDNFPRRVVSVCSGVENLYRVKGGCGSYTVNESHILSLKSFEGEVRDVSVVDYLEASILFRKRFRGYRVPVRFEPRDVRIDPYLMGCLFFDTIPREYVFNSKRVRMDYLAGMLDTDGVYDSVKHSYFLRLKGRGITRCAVFLVRSLGMKAKVFESLGGTPFLCKGRNRIFRGLILRITGRRITQIPCRVATVLNRVYRWHEEDCLNDPELLYKIQLESLGKGEYFGFELERVHSGPAHGTGRFLLGDFSVTHNTTMALWLSSQVVKLKTLVIVNKEVLMDQWVSRITEFLPSAEIGIIRGGVVEIENKHIVIGMLQSLALKDYPSKVFEGFGFVVIDECHCINSRVFSKVLFKVQGRYRIGLSATPKRKDGLDKVVVNHIGDVICKMERTVHVPKVMVVESPKAEGLIVKKTFKGVTNLSRLITDLSEHPSRNQFLIETVKDVLRTEPSRKIIAFSDRINQCEILAETLNSEGEFSAGTFAGKKRDPEVFDKCQVVFSTYSLTKEGFDRKDLDTAIFATPKSDVVQCIGRILRQKNKNFPLVIDIKDTYPDSLLFQFYRRNRYYNSQKFERIKR